jgi:hypothetical protein
MTASEPPDGDAVPNRRSEERFALLRGLAGEVMVFQPMAICEISVGGLQVETTFPLHLDSLHDFRLTLGTQPVVVKGRVTHCSLVDVDQDAVRYRSGIQFIDLPQRTLSVIEEFLDRLRDGRRGR